MATTVDEFEELLNVEQQVDLPKLALAAKHGIPDKVRQGVWFILLNVQHSDKLANLDNVSHAELHFIKNLRGEVRRYFNRRSSEFNSKEAASLMEQVLTLYFCNHHSKAYSASFVSIIGPLVYVFNSDQLVYGAFSKVVSYIDDWFANEDLDQQISNFLMMFRLLLPDLYNHFQDEEVDIREWLSSWFETILSKQLPLDSILRLWDTYFSSTEKLSMHSYVCLSILHHCKDDLEELDQSEIHSYLNRLPLMNMDAIILHAYQLKAMNENS
ncbi:rab-GTPase-TBC domain-containing protein [Globomyces pollinis-pini]|nr:rab-GTPase-TBC domain-containing protein [Globomyces pollinis-pini]